MMTEAERAILTSRVRRPAAPTPDHPEALASLRSQGLLREEAITIRAFHRWLEGHLDREARQSSTA